MCQNPEHGFYVGRRLAEIGPMTSHTSAALAIAAGIVDALPYDIPRGYRAALKNDIAFALDARRREALEEAARLGEER